MEELMSKGWRFEFFLNKLETYTCVARKGDKKVMADDFALRPLQVEIVKKCDEVEFGT